MRVWGCRGLPLQPARDLARGRGRRAARVGALLREEAWPCSSRRPQPGLGELFDAASALADVGLDTDVVGPEVGAPEKTTFVVLMYLGRIELLITGILAATTHPEWRDLAWSRISGLRRTRLKRRAAGGARWP